MCLWKELALCPAINPHIHPSASGLLCGRRGGMEVAQNAGRTQVGWASPALSDGSVRLIPWRGRALCFKQWTRLKDMLGVHKYEMVFRLPAGS